MKAHKLLLVFPPFCIPTSPPYSLGYLKRFLEQHSAVEIKTLDLNLEFHKRTTNNPFTKELDIQKYEQVSKKFMLDQNKIYVENNKKIRFGEKPELFDEFVEMLLKEKPDFVAFSCFYNQQIFYATALSKILREKNIRTALGGPAMEPEYKDRFDELITDEFHFLRWLKSLGINTDSKDKTEKPTLNFDFSDFKLDEYFSPAVVLPVRSSRGCYYNKCAFCTHSAKTRYYQTPIEEVKKEIAETGQKYFQFIDDMISAQRLAQISEAIKDLDVRYTALTKPSSAFTSERLKRIYDGGCRSLLWGLESGSQRILDLMEKGTTVEECAASLKNSHEAGIKNLVYVMFGFPTETKDDFMKTFKFLDDNKEYIDLVSTAVFGLQRGSPVFANPKKYGITNIIEHKRTVLMSNFTYEVGSGLTAKEAEKIRDNHIRAIRKIGKYPYSFVSTSRTFTPAFSRSFFLRSLFLNCLPRKIIVPGRTISRFRGMASAASRTTT
ncbi:MAG: radical SAM protein [Nanoarchaeota archaeon]|nr:radical SAM protein [Nanoarchaeota archaeon]